MPLAWLGCSEGWLADQNYAKLTELEQLTIKLLGDLPGLLVEAFEEVDGVDYTGQIRIEPYPVNRWTINGSTYMLYLQPGNGKASLPQISRWFHLETFRKSRRAKIANAVTKRLIRLIEGYVGLGCGGPVIESIDVEVCPVDGSGHALKFYGVGNGLSAGITSSWGIPDDLAMTHYAYNPE